MGEVGRESSSDLEWDLNQRVRARLRNSSSAASLDFVPSLAEREKVGGVVLATASMREP
jgi:hypothetical protein